MKLSQTETVSKSVKLGTLAVLMILLGYPGEISTDSGTRWLWWGLSMVPFTLIMVELYGGLKNALASQPANVQSLLNGARNLTVVSWLFYPIVFILPMIGLTGGSAMAAVQVGYTIADIVAKAVFGILIYVIAVRKSENEPGFVAKTAEA
jgi:bacteriorhodopsin